LRADRPVDESARLEALRGYGILDTPPEALYEEITKLAAHVCGVPASAISLIDEDRQWFKAIFGMDAEESPRDVAFCAHTILEDDVMVVEDATTDRRFADNPFVLSDPQIRFYAGAPLVTSEGHALGALCVIDTQPRQLSPEQVDALRMLGRQVMTQLGLRIKLEQLAAANAGREQAAAELQRTYRSLRSAVAGAPLMLSVLDRDGVFELSEGGGLGLLGLEAGEVVGRSVFDHYADSPQVLSLIRRAMAGEASSEDVEVGDLVFESSHTPLFDEAGEVTGIVVLSLDVTERTRARIELLDTNAELERSREEAREAFRLKSAFLANMSHEIRTPLNGVVGMTELLLETALDQEQQEYARVAVSSTEALLGVIDDILDFSKIEAGKLSLHSVEFSPRETVADVCKMLAVTAQAKGLEMSSSVRGEVPSTMLGDETRLRQVLTNLMSNAVKFTPSGKVAVEVSADSSAGQEAVLRVEVTDTGMGIGASRIEALFDPFHQADVSTTRSFGGTGLGLAISKELVELMGGRIGAVSEPGRGSTFWFTARLHTSPGSTAEVPIPADVPPSRKPDLPLVLVVEDNEVNQIVAQAMLAELGYESEVAVNGFEALESLERGSFVAILMDCQMPVLDGYEATAEIRRREGDTRHTPIIATTAHAREGDRERCLAAGMDDYVAKPVRRVPLGEALNKLRSREPTAPGSP